MQPSVVHIILGTLSQPVLGVVFTTFFDTTSHCSLGQVWQFSPWSSHLVSFTVLHSGTSSLTFWVEISCILIYPIIGGYMLNCRVLVKYHCFPSTVIDIFWILRFFMKCNNIQVYLVYFQPSPAFRFIDSFVVFIFSCNCSIDTVLDQWCSANINSLCNCLLPTLDMTAFPVLIFAFFLLVRCVLGPIGCVTFLKKKSW